VSDSTQPIFALASWRVAATVIDLLVFVALLLVVFLIGGELTTATVNVTGAVSWLAFAAIEGHFGASPGKTALGLQVTLADGRTSPIGFRLAMIRRVPDFVAIVPVIGQLLSIALGAASIVMVRRDTEQRRSPYDWVSDTRVVVDPQRHPR
jgi:uncharacterized RDD family membrane protein YckC